MKISKLKDVIYELVNVAEYEFTPTYFKNIDNACVEICEKLDKLANYEDKLEQGLLIELPVPLGETVYRLVPKTYRKIETITISEYLVRGNMLYYKSKKSGLLYPCSEIGETVFLARSEAEEALAKMGGK